MINLIAMDVYDDSPTIVTIWLTIMPKISIFILLLELFTKSIGFEVGLLTANNINGIELINNINISSLNYTNEISNINIFNKEWTNYFTEIKILLLISSLLSLILGTIVGLAQTRIKRLLAYSTISHIGFILLALAISTEQSIESLLFYIVQYSITNLNTFLILISLSYLIYNSVLQRYLYCIIKNNKYFTIISITLQTIKPNILYIIFLKMENLLNLFPDFIFRSKNSNIIKLSKEIKKGLIDTDIKYISELKGQFLSNPLLSLSLSICLFSMAGIPPVKNYGKILWWAKLSNSGNTLKLIVPSYIRKFISGWNNYSGKVISYKMKETEMGNRGSKSVLDSSTVKEQRVYGSYLKNFYF